MRRNERILLEVRDQYLSAKDVSYHRSGTSSYPSPSTLTGVTEAELVLDAAKVSENARKIKEHLPSYADALFFNVTESILRTANVTDIFQFFLFLFFFLLGNPTGLSWPNNRDSKIVLQILPESVQRRS